MRNWLLLILSFFIFGCAHQPSRDKSQPDKVTIFLYPNNLLKAAAQDDQAVEATFNEYFLHLGRNGPGGEVGAALVFPYLAWTEGSGSGPYQIPSRLKAQHETILRLAYKFKIPVLVQFNGAVWHSPSTDSAFIRYWKTVNGGQYLSRYQDGRVNSALTQKGKISATLLTKYLATEPYGDNKENSLFFTLSPFAAEFRLARLDALQKAVKFWKGLDEKYPGTIRAFTTDSEVSNLSFRTSKNKDREIHIGFEDWNTKPFCEKNDIEDCGSFLKETLNIQKTSKKSGISLEYPIIVNLFKTP